MRTVYWMVVGLMWVSRVVYADVSLPMDKPVNATTLTEELHAADPSVTGLAVDTDKGVVEVHGMVSEADKAALLAVLKAHDASKTPPKDEPVEIPLESFGAGVAGALAAMGGQFVIKATKKKEGT